jgi:hypothetical protein
LEICRLSVDRHRILRQRNENCNGNHDHQCAQLSNSPLHHAESAAITGAFARIATTNRLRRDKLAREMVPRARDRATIRRRIKIMPLQVTKPPIDQTRAEVIAVNLP